MVQPTRAATAWGWTWRVLAVAVPLLVLGAIVATRVSDIMAARSVEPARAAAAPAKPALPPVVAPAAPVEPAPPPTPAAEPVAKADPNGPDFTVKRILDIPGRIKFGTFYWDEAGVPPGPIVVTVDLAAQTISVFRGGYEIGTAAIIYGDDGLPTPLGIFPILQKDADHVSNLYDAPMPYMLRLTNDGVAIHGSNVRKNYATHGCVGVPTPFAKLLFGVTKVGDRVIITRNKRLPKKA